MRELINQIADQMSRELAVNGWVLLIVMALLVFMTIIVVVFVNKYSKEHRHLIASRDISIDYMRECKEFKCRVSVSDGTIKSLNEKLRNATEQNRRLAVEQAIAILKTHHLPLGVGGIDIHSTYKEIYRFLAGKA